MLDHVLFDRKSFSFAHRIHVDFGPILWIGLVTEMQILFFRWRYPVGIDINRLIQRNEEREKKKKQY